MIPKALTAGQIRRLDRLAIKTAGIPSLALMDNAGRMIAEAVVRLCRVRSKPRVCVICGPGNNGGDGFVAARYLCRRGVKTNTFFIGKAGGLKRDSLFNYRMLKKSKYPVCSVSKLNRTLQHSILKSGVIVDAIFGFGLNRRVGGPFADIIRFINFNRDGKKIVAVDIPSGLDATTGRVHGVCVRADTTVTFSAAKRGFYKAAGRLHAGRVQVVDIGIPKKLFKQV